MTIDIDIFLNALLAYFVIVDPLGVALLFHALTGNHDPSAYRNTAARAAVLSLLVILGFGFFGATILGHLGITMEAFRIAGGLLLFFTAFSMVTRPDVSPKCAGLDPTNDIAVFPLSIPMIAGPGSLTLTIMLFSKVSQKENGLLSVSLAIVIILLLTLVTLLLSRRIAAVVGKTTNAVITRLLGVLLAALSVQFVADGIIGLVGQAAEALALNHLLP